MKVENHPRVKLMMKSREAIRSELEFSILFVSGDKGYLDVNDFVELHRNMYWVTPKENFTNFVSIFLNKVTNFNILSNIYFSMFTV